MWVVWATLMLVLAGCGPQQSGGGEARPELVIGGANDLAMLVVIAKRRGYFDAQGTPVRYRRVQTGKVALDALSTRDLDLGVIVDTNVAYAGFSGKDWFRVIASIQRQTGDAVVARADSGIATVGDLRGKRVGYLPATTSHVFLSRLLQRHGMSLDDLRLLSMAPPAMQSAIVRGDVDAVSIFQPFRAAAVDSLGANAVVFTDPQAYTAYALLAARDDVVADRSEDLRHVLAALIEASKFAAAHPKETLAMLTAELDLTPDTMRRIRKDFILEVAFGPGIKALVEEEGEWIRSTQREFEGAPAPDYSAYFDPSLLAAVSPSPVDGS